MTDPSIDLTVTDGAEAAHENDRHRWFLLATLVTGLLGTGMTMTVIALAVGELALDLDSSEAFVSWGVTGAILGSVAGSSILGKVADVYGRREVYLACLFALVCLLLVSGAANTGWLFVGARCLSGVTTGGAQAAAAAMLYDAFPGEDRSKAIGIFTAVMTGAPALGLLIGGPAIDAIGWRSLFVVLAGVALLAAVSGLRIIGPSSASERVSIDYLGGLVVSLSVAAALAGLTVGGARGWSDPITLLLLVAAPIGLAAFVWIEHHAVQPILRLDYLSRRYFIVPTLSATCNSFAFMGGLIVTPLLLVSRFGYSISTASAVLFVRPAMYSVSSLVGGVLLPRLGGRRILVGSAAILSGALLLHALAASQGRLIWLWLGLLGAGVGGGVATTAVGTLTADASDPEDYAMAAGMRSVITQIGVTSGIQTLTVILGSGRAGSDFVVPYLVAAGVAFVGVPLAATLTGSPRATG